MHDTVAVWTVMMQCIAAGLVAGLCVLHTVWRRDDPGNEHSHWTLIWSIALAAVFFCDALALVSVGTVWHDPLTVLAAVALAVALLLALPVAHSYADGPPFRAYLIVASAGFALHTVLLVTGFVTARTEPRIGALHTATSIAAFLVPAAVVGLYLAVSLRRTPSRRTRRALVGAAGLSVTLLVVSYLAPSATTRSALASAWLVPLIVALEVLALRRIRHGQRKAEQQRSMRDAQARLSNLAWYVRDPHALLRRAEEEARELLGDPTIRGTIRTLSRGRFVTDLSPHPHIATDPSERKLLMALANVVSSAAERHALAARLSRAAFSDALTGLPNRNAIDEHLVNAIERGSIERSRVALLYADLDGFKHVNDQYGHAWGDQILVLASAHLRETVGDDVFVARLGGDEFIIVVERAGDDAALLRLASRIRDDFLETSQGRPIPRISVGITVSAPGDTIDAEALTLCADIAMLEAKRTKVGVLVFDKHLEAQVAAENLLHREINKAVEEEQFCVHFQPIVDTTTLQVLGLEALARWEFNGRLREPREWLDYAETSGLIVAIGNMTFRKAFAATERFDLPVAINLSARQLAEPTIVEDLAAAWGDRDWSMLTVEITEGALLQDEQQTVSMLAQLRSRGARIALDDFGTGYNSLARLATLPIDILKIDQSFVRNMSSPPGLAVLRAIVALAAAHDLEVVAEGIEQVFELETFVELGVRRAQGNMLGRPAAAVPVR
ncbi:diguanylate cyclase (GGDEF) domain-containing protein [Sanguibacter gelidistatuariae]|uniref:Diguanylate cyclase (GGDEF) domain-containing protein n=1 Tax=Sanguibacter gelidistatuariae TaxID=1814289 RepID=A0A1G6JMQ6_9MICO|nr:EAL domain-containing protein [Sanguibacter gelidistatuariae]SDC20014.1 diguanylate cyclase (GGDEF) domain-containing protein [Sanguibacter gelidistatuariae]